MPSGTSSRRNVDPTLAPNQYRRRIIASGILIGLGLAGLLDTIIFHHILQWHHMVSNIIPPTTVDTIRFNIFADGAFSTFSIIVIAIGTGLFLSMVAIGRSRPPPLLVSRYLIGLVLLGFGIFNAYDGVVNHMALGLHHAIEMPNPLFADLIWLLTLGFAFIGAGVFLIKQKHNMDETNNTPTADLAAAA